MGQHTHKHRPGGERGFSLIELLIIIGMVSIIGGMAIWNVQAALAMARADTIASQVASVLRLGRDTAMAQRRTVDVRFVAPNRVLLVRNDVPVGTTQIAEVFLENNGRFLMGAGLPDTPDGFGRASEIDFDGAATVRFQPDGTLTDETAVPINGTIYLGIPNEPLAARAVTVTGTTARSQPYRWTGSRWDVQ